MSGNDAPHMTKIFNIMLSRGLGGIEQSFLDYSEALKNQNYDVVNIVSVGAKIARYKLLGPFNDAKLLNLGSWDYLSIFHLKFLISIHKPDIIIAHGNRAISFANKAKRAGVKLIAVSHNYNIKHIRSCDYIFVLTNHLMNYLLANNVPEYKMKLIPNMIKLSSAPDIVDFPEVLTIGAMGRFVKKKGFDHFLYSLSLLKSRGVKFKAVIAGDGEEKSNLLKLRAKLNLTNEVTFTGWVYDKESFFKNIDIFCLPSLHEPFGIIVLEAMKYGKAIVSSASEGPGEIILHEKTGLLSPVADDVTMSGYFEYLIRNRDKAKELSRNAYLSVERNYDMKVVSKILHYHLEQILHDISMH